MKFETVVQAAARLGVTVRAIQKWAKEGKLKGAQKVGRDWMIPVDSIVKGSTTTASTSTKIPYPFFQVPYTDGDMVSEQ